MNPQQAIGVLGELSNKFIGSKQEHVLFQQAIETLSAALKKPESEPEPKKEK